MCDVVTVRGKRIPKNKIREFMADEKKGYVDYKKAGLDNLAQDEKRHYKYLEGLSKK